MVTVAPARACLQSLSVLISSLLQVDMESAQDAT